VNRHHIAPGTQPSTAVLITGCSSGIGHATALALAKAGFPVWASARKAGGLGELEVDGPYAVYKANVAKMAARAHRDGAPGVLEADDVAAVILKAVTAVRPKARYKAGSQARLAPVARHILGDRGWDAFMRYLVPFPAPR
jgi:D-arabinose 1-dehydrogenase-like Zn-dependent alcohol dehydrogenase